MMRQYELVERVRRYNPRTDEILLNRAYVYAMKAHGSQVRASGDPYFSHPLEVAAILTDLHLDDATIVAGVLHDTIEDTESTREEIDRVFGREIGLLVDGLTKLKRIDLVSKRAAQAENFRKLLLAIAADVRVLLVKLADRLHNMRTLHFVPPDKRRRIAEDFDAAFQEVDALLTPTAPSAAFALGDRVSDPLAMYLNDVFTVTVNLAGLPGISIPAGVDASGLPLGLQLIGRALDEGTLFTLAGTMEQAAALRVRPEPWW